MLALGCEDGTVRLLSIADDTLKHHKRFDRVKCRILSVAWGPPIPKENPSQDEEDDDDDEWVDTWLVTGCSDSSLRKWDASTGRMLDRMGTDKIRGERTLVWTVTTLGLVFVLFSAIDISHVSFQGRDRHLWRLFRYGEVLGLADMYPVAKLSSTWSRCALFDSWTCSYSILLQTRWSVCLC